MRIALLPLILLVPLAAPALAEKSRAINCDDEPACARLTDEAYEASRQGRFEDAERAYEQAHARWPDPKLLYNLARVLHKAHKPAKAASVYEKYLGAGAEGNEAKRRKASEFLAQARREAAAGTSQTPLSGTPLYRRWWLWTAVGVVAAGIAIGVGIGVASRRPDLDNAYPVQPF